MQNASFSIEISLYRNDSLSSEIQAYDDVYVPDFLFVLVQLEIDPTNERFYLQVLYIDKYCNCNYIWYSSNQTVPARDKKWLYGFLIKLSPVYHTQWRLHNVTLAAMLNVKHDGETEKL